jgi:hypothetical protein
MAEIPPACSPVVSIADAGGGRLAGFVNSGSLHNPAWATPFSILPVFNPTTGVNHGNPLQHQHLARAIATDRLLAAHRTAFRTDQTPGTAKNAAKICSRWMACPGQIPQSRGFCDRPRAPPMRNGSQPRCTPARTHPNTPIAQAHIRQPRHALGVVGPHERCVRGTGAAGRNGASHSALTLSAFAGEKWTL